MKEATQLDVSLVTVTPGMAETWLGRNTRNRHLRKRIVGAYARDMAAGHWQVTGEAIKFDDNGKLIDGQHRLHAVIRSGVSVQMLVIRGLRQSAQDVLDTGARRSVADVLALEGKARATHLAAAARCALAFESGMLHSGGGGGAGRVATSSEVREFLESNPDLERAVEATSTLRRSIDLTPATTAVTWWLCARADEDACVEFFTALAHAQTSGPGDPRLALIRRLGNARRANERLSQAAQISLVVRAWNAWRRGSQLASMPVSASVPKPI